MITSVFETLSQCDVGSSFFRATTRDITTFSYVSSETVQLAQCAPGKRSLTETGAVFQRLLGQTLSVHTPGLTETPWRRSGDGVRVTSGFVSQVKPTSQWLVLFLRWNFKLGSTSTQSHPP